MTPPQPRGNERLLNALVQETADLKTLLQLLQQEQRVQGQCLEGLKKGKHATEERLHRLEDFKLASLQRWAFFKGFALKALPFLAAFSVLCFSIGKVWEDTEKAVKEVEQQEAKQHGIERRA